MSRACPWSFAPALGWLRATARSAVTARLRTKPKQAGCRVSVLLIVLSIATGGVAPAAPLPPFAPVDLCGDIVWHTWTAEQQIPGQAGFSGSLGHDRVFPARFRVLVRHYNGIDAETARFINGLLSHSGAAQDEVMLLLNSQDPHLLDDATSLCVRQFVIHGDEGGTWTDYRDLAVSR